MDSILLFLVVFPLVGAFVSYLIGRKNKTLRDYFVAFVCILDLVIMFSLFIQVANGAEFNYYVQNICGGTLHFQLDGFRAIYGTICALMWTMTSLFSHEYFHHYRNRNRYFFFLLLTFAGTMGVFLSGNLYTTFIFFELMSMASYVTVIHDEKPKAMRAGDTYLFIAVLGGMVMLMGLFLLQNTVGTLEIDKLHDAIASYKGDRGLLWASALCLLFGFGAKAGMFPVHIWLPKAHPVAPAPASALLSGILTKSGVYGILILTSRIFLHDADWGTLILYIGVITMFLGAVLAVFSIDLKRTLACSSMSQIGFILVACGMQGLLGEHNALAVRGALLHMVNHSMFKLVLFMVAGAVYMNLHKLDLNDIKGFGRGKILLNFAYLAGFLGIIGMPAFSGYVSKTLIHESIVEYIEELHVHGHGTIIYNIIEWIFLISGGLTAAYMTKLYICLFCEKNNDAKVQEKYNSLNKTYMSKLSAFAIDGSAIIVFVLGLNSFVTQVLNGETHSSNATLMDKLATIGQEFMHGHNPSHAVNYFSWANLKGGLISLAIGAIVYIFVIRQLLMKKVNDKKVYINVWPEWLDLEDSVYRPVLNVIINVLAFVFRIADKLIDGIVALLRSTLFVAINTIKTGDAFAVLNVESKSSKSVKTITDSLSMSLLLFCLGLCIALIYLVVLNT